MFKDNSRKVYNIIFYMRDREKINYIRKRYQALIYFKRRYMDNDRRYILIHKKVFETNILHT